MIDNYCSNWVMSSELIVEEAKKMGLKINIIEKSKNFYSISNGKNKIYFKTNDCGIDSSIGIKIADDKELSHIIAQENNIKTPKTIYLKREELNSFDYDNVSIKFPLVTKPVNGAHGNGVSLNINSANELKKAINYSFSDKKTTKIIIQEEIKGDDFRIIIIGGKFIAGVKRVAPSVIGNGKNTIGELIEIYNNGELISKGDHDGIKNKIKVDSEAETCISKKGYSLDSILEKGEKVYVRENGNLSTGGISIDVTDIVNKDIINESIKFSKLLGLGLTGVDIMTNDITKSLEDSNGAIIEINNTPGLKMHHFPSEGKPRNVARELLKYVFS